MNAMTYLLLTRVKNSIRELFHKPARLIYAIFLLLLVGVSVFSGAAGQDAASSFRDRAELYAIVLALYAVITVMSTMTGLQSGATFYSMSDVNFLFCAPFSSKRILIYGLVRQLGTTALMGLLLVFQYGWLSNVYGVGAFDMAAMIVGYIIVVFCSQLLAMGIYSVSSGNERRKRGIRMGAYLFCILAVVYLLLPVFHADRPLDAVVQRANSPVFYFFPIAGWMKALAQGMMTGNLTLLCGGLGASVLCTGIFILVIFKLDADYYEDVLASTEVSFSAITAKKEGRVAEAAPKNVKLGKTGIGAGCGATVFFYKHLLENRRSRIFLFDAVTLIFLACNLGFAFFMRESGLVPVLVFSMYLMMFESFTGRWVRELTQPYVYMIPVKPFQKLVMICGEHILKSVVLSVVTITAAGLIVGAAPAEILAGIFARIGISFLFIAANVLTDRLFGAIPGKALQIFFYFLVLIILLIPEIAAAVLVASLTESLAAGIFVIFLVSALVSAGILFLCRNILSNAELNHQ